MNYDEISRSATKGDKEAQRALMSLAEEQFNKGEFEKAAEVFKDVAIAYRIAAFRNSGLEGEARGEALWNKKVLEIYKKWIMRGEVNLEHEHAGIKKLSIEQIRKTVVEQPPQSEQDVFLFDYLEMELMKRGVEFYSPGGSPLRYILRLLNVLASQGELSALDSTYLGFIRELEIRVALDQIADEVVRRCSDNMNLS